MMPIARSVAAAFVPPLAVFLLLNAAFAASARHAGEDFFAYDSWIKWDSGHYLSIADKGYEFMSCSEVPGYDPDDWCGNAGWFPGYPFLLRGFNHLTGAPAILLAILASQLFTLANLLIVWNLFLSRRHALVLLLCAFAPGTYYFLVGFPMSMVVCFVLIALWAQKAAHHGVATVAGAIAALTYPSGVWLSGVMAAALLLRRRAAHSVPRRAWLAVAGPPIGFGVVLLIHALSVGQWNAFFLTQAKYGHAVNNPVVVLWSRSLYVWFWRPGWQIGLQSLLATALVIAAATVVARARRRRTDEPGDAAAAVHGLVYWLLPLMIGGGLSPYRAESLLMPALTGLRGSGSALLVALIPVEVLAWLIMATKFVEGWLV